MAAQARRRSRYETYGSAAYDPAWSGGTLAAPQREEIFRPRPKVRPKERTLVRPRIQVREAGKVSPFAIIGFLAVGVFAVLMLMCYVELTVLSDESVQLRSQLSALKGEEAKLLTQYELAYDLQAIEAQVSANGSMIKPVSNQIVVLDVSEPDNVVVYGDEETGGGLLEEVKSLIADIAS